MLFSSFVNDLIIKLLSILKFSKKFVVVIITGEWYMGIIIDGHCYFHWFLGELFVWKQLNTFRLIVILLLLLLLYIIIIILVVIISLKFIISNTNNGIIIVVFILIVFIIIIVISQPDSEWPKSVDIAR